MGKILKRTIYVLEFVTDAGIFLLSLMIFLAGLYALYDNYLVYLNANDTSLLSYKPDDKEPIQEERKLKHMVAWLTLEGTSIDVPVMQGKDNMEYLNKDPYGNYSLAGSIFLDSRNSPDFSDFYSLIYGHHMEHGAMFGALDQFLEESFFLAHRDGTLIVSDTCYTIRLIAVVEAKGEEEAIFSPTEKDELTVPFLKQHARFLDEEIPIEEGDHLVGMSTCKYPNTSDRIIVFGILTDRQESNGGATGSNPE